MNRFLPHAVASLLLVVGCSDQSVSSQPLPPPDASPDAPPEASDAGQMPTSMITIDLGTVEPGIPTTFVAPKGTLGFNVVAVPSKGAEKAGIKELISPDGTKHVRGGIPERASFPFFYSGFAATGIPRGASSVAMTDKSGKWSVTFHGSSPLKASVHLQVTSDGRFHGGDLDLHVYIPIGLQIHDPGPMHPVSAATAHDDPAVKERLDTYFSAMKTMFGVDRGKVAFHEIDAAYVTVDENNFGAAFAESANVAVGQAMHVVWTSTLSLYGNETWGASPAVPGGPIFVGHPGAGIVLALSADTSATGDGLTMLHETGHFVGLQHTTELSGGLSDPLDDTPACAEIEQSFSGCADKSNLMFPMFWGATGGRGVAVSDDQRAVFHGSPVYRARSE